MAVFKFTWIFNDYRQGWSESWYYTGSNIESSTVTSSSGATVRMRLIGKNVILEAARVSDVTIRGDSTFTPFAGVQPVQAAVQDTAWNCWLCRVEAGALYRKSMYLRGCPDDWIAQEENGQFIQPQALRNAIGEFQDFAIGTLALRVAEKIPDASYIKITGITADPDGYIRFAAAATGAVLGDTVTVKSYQGPDRSILNGQHAVRAGDGASVTINTLFALLLDPLANVKGVIAKRNIIYPTVTRIRPLRPVKRSTGRAFFVPVGRRRRRR